MRIFHKRNLMLLGLILLITACVPTAVEQGTMEPTAVEPTAVEPTAIEPTVNELTNTVTPRPPSTDESPEAEPPADDNFTTIIVTPRDSPLEAPILDPEDKEIVVGDANVAGIALHIMESFPVQISVTASGNLPDNCTEIQKASQRREENTIYVDLFTSRPADIMCTQVITPFEEVISLDVAGLPAGTYTVNVNGITEMFTLEADNGD